VVVVRIRGLVVLVAILGLLAIVTATGDLTRARPRTGGDCCGMAVVAVPTRVVCVGIRKGCSPVFVYKG